MATTRPRRRLAHQARPATVRPRDPRRGDKGYILAKTALLIVPLLLMSGLSVDVGYWYSRASDIQKAADAAALAGVVWLPDVPKARQYALEAAARNGFVDGQDDVTIAVAQAGDRRLRVTIRDNSVGSFFWDTFGGSTISMSRKGLAEYVLPVPMGSPRNYFGTGPLVTGDPELLYQSVNPSCTSKVNGDRHQSLHYNPLSSGGTSLSSCVATPSNTSYRPTGYQLYVEAPAGRSSDLDVLLYDPRYNDTDVTWEEQTGEDCVTSPVYNPTSYPSTWTIGTQTTEGVLTGPIQYRTRTSDTTTTWSSIQTLQWGQTYTFSRELRVSWRLPDGVSWTPGIRSFATSTATGTMTLNGPAFWQTKQYSSTAWSNSAVNASGWLNAGQSRTITRNLTRYRIASLPSQTTCTPIIVTHTDNNVDSKRQSGDETYTFKMYAADNTPLDDSDNPEMPACTKTYTKDTAFDLTYLGSVRWNRLCTITPTMTSGRYILQVTNNGANPNLGSDGSNQWGLVAKYTGATGDGLCDGRTDTMCPRVYGREAISVYANTSSATAQFFLAEIEPEHNGKTLELELWDPGEGGSSISFLKPTGANTWAATPFSWTSFNEDGSVANAGLTNQTSVSVTNSVFNGKLLRIQIPLTNYSPPSDNYWWKIQYTFTSGSVTDRTTWSAKVTGDPVHLIEEEAA